MVRQSTDTLAVQDEDVARAVRFIREHAADQLTVEEVLEEVGVSRRGLDGKFQDILGYSVFQEIRRAQIDRAMQLLRDSDLILERVAQLSGFGGGRHLGLEFKKRTGQSPGAYRKQFRRT